MSATTKTPIFTDPHDLAVIFTSPSPIKTKYLPGTGLKPFEAFMNDIIDNLTAWAADGSCIFYRTTKHLYVMERVVHDGCPIITMARFVSGTWARCDSWVNEHTFNLGKAWLQQPEQLAKRVPVFPG